MMILTKVLSLLLAITATSVSQPPPDHPHQKDADKAIKVSLMRIKMSYVENLNCVKTEKLNLRLKVNDLVPGLLDSSQAEFFCGDSQGSFIKDDPYLYTGNVKVEPQGIENLKDSINSIDEIFNELEADFHTHRNLVKDVSEQAVSSINALEEVLAAMVEDAQLDFSTQSNQVKMLAELAVENLKLHISTP